MLLRPSICRAPSLDVACMVTRDYGRIQDIGVPLVRINSFPCSCIYGAFAPAQTPQVQVSTLLKTEDELIREYSELKGRVPEMMQAAARERLSHCRRNTDQFSVRWHLLRRHLSRADCRDCCRSLATGVSTALRYRPNYARSEMILIAYLSPRAIVANSIVASHCLDEKAGSPFMSR